MRRLIVVVLLTACSGPTPGQQLAADKADYQRRLIGLYGYQSYAECRGRGLGPLSHALLYCLDAHGPSPEALARVTSEACRPEETVVQCDQRLSGDAGRHY